MEVDLLTQPDSHEVLWDYCLENDLIMDGSWSGPTCPEWLIWQAQRSNVLNYTRSVIIQFRDMAWSDSGYKRTGASVSGEDHRYDYAMGWQSTRARR